VLLAQVHIVHTCLVKFQEKDIPPAEIDPDTSMVLHTLLEQRNKADAELYQCLKDVTADGANRDPHRDTDTEYERLNKAHNNANRSMYQVYSE
jgi:hypothetical protein